MNKVQRSTGLVFDIQRFATNDGPGIRTTVFLKGCPLSCHWCHNPESQSFKPQLSFKADRCTHCFNCVEICPEGAHFVSDNRHRVEFTRCGLHGACIETCPSEALKIFGREMTVGAVMRVVLKDQAYYENSGGGLTISGGEPMAQPRFTSALLAAAKSAGIHTCLDTSGYAPQSHFEKIREYVDLFLFDYKVTDPEEHKRQTGVENRLILQNLDYLYTRGARILLRCPIIPGLNDTPGHHQAIAGLEQRYPRLHGIEKLPYHETGIGKYGEIGKEIRSTLNPVTQKSIPPLTPDES